MTLARDARARDIARSHPQSSMRLVLSHRMHAEGIVSRQVYGIVFQKLLNRGLPVSVVRFLSSWYPAQQMCVRWNNLTRFRVSNSVRQGALLKIGVQATALGVSPVCASYTPLGC